MIRATGVRVPCLQVKIILRFLPKAAGVFILKTPGTHSCVCALAPFVLFNTIAQGRGACREFHRERALPILGNQIPRYPYQGQIMMDDTSPDDNVPAPQSQDDPPAGVSPSKLRAYRKACIRNHYRQNWRTCRYKGCRRNQRCMGGPRGTFTRFGQPWCTGSCYIWEPPAEWLKPRQE